MKFLNFLKKQIISFISLLKVCVSCAFSKKNYQYTLIVALFWLFLTWILSSEYMPKDNFIVGQPALKDVKALVDFTQIDKEATEQARLAAAKTVPNIMSTDGDITNKVLGSLSYTLEQISNERKRKKTDPLSDLSTDANDVKFSAPIEPETSFPVFVSREIFDELLTFDEMTFVNLKQTAMTITRSAMEMGVSSAPGNSSLVSDESISEIQENVDSLNLPDNEKKVIFALVSNSVRPNKVQDWVAIKDLQAKRMSEVKPVSVFIAQGQTIIREGEIVTPKHLELLGDMDIYRPSLLLQGVFAGSTAVFIMLVILYFGARMFAPSILSDKRLLLLVALITLGTTSLCSFTTHLPISEAFGAYILRYMTPVAIASILIQMVAGSSFAVLVTIVICILVSMMTHSASAGITGLFTGVAAIIVFSNTRKRTEMLWAAVIVTAVNMLAAWITNTYISEDDVLMWSPVAVAAVNGSFSCVLAIGAMFFVENLFPVVTNVRLLDIANPTEYLLRELTSKAPGTHVHSILVANLAEAGASEIGANPLLARVGAYYHDIGKTKHPSMFIENQFGALNPHDKCASTLSKVIITSHVKQGVELAKKYKLPEPIIDIIAQHHGTSLLKYFHFQALKTDKNAREEDFRYPGPKPQTKEAAVVMMADSIEAAVRSLKNVDLSKIESMIDAIINGMLNDGQFNDCELSFKDISKLKKKFLQSMASLYHTRIEYPEQKKY